MIVLDDLLAYCFEGRHPAFEAEFGGWLRTSRRLRAFVADNRAKIRAKLRPVRDEAGLLDVRAELAAAAALLHNDSFTLVYEAYAAAKGAGPDFTLTFKTHTRFNVEVRRFRWGEAKDGGADGSANAGAFTARLAAVLGDKVRQMPPSSINFLWLATDGGVDVDDVAEAAALLRGRAECKDEAFFTRRGYASATAFLKQYGQMSGVLLWQDNAAALWLNPLARHKPAPELAAALRRTGA